MKMIIEEHHSETIRLKDIARDGKSSIATYIQVSSDNSHGREDKCTHILLHSNHNHECETRM